MKNLRSLKRVLCNTVSIERKNETTDAYGGITNKWEKQDWLVKCRIHSEVGRIVITFEGKEYNITHRFLCQVGENLEEGDKLTNQDTLDKYMLVQLTKIYEKQRVHHLQGELVRINE